MLCQEACLMNEKQITEYKETKPSKRSTSNHTMCNLLNTVTISKYIQTLQEYNKSAWHCKTFEVFIIFFRHLNISRWWRHFSWLPEGKSWKNSNPLPLGTVATKPQIWFGHIELLLIIKPQHTAKSMEVSSSAFKKSQYKKMQHITGYLVLTTGATILPFLHSQKQKSPTVS